ncbi:MAG: DUF429 domain-containing protein [Vicinamibacterales bacterium]
MSIDAFVGIDVAVAKTKRLPVCVCVRRDGNLEPLALRDSTLPLPPSLPGNVAIVDPAVRQRLAEGTAAYLRAIQDHFGLQISTIAIDAPSAPRAMHVPVRRAEASLGLAGISYIHTPDVDTFARIPGDVNAHLENPGARRGLPHANRIWMLFGFELFRVVASEGWPCIEVYPQATVRCLAGCGLHKKKPGAVLEQLSAASTHTGWPVPPTTAALRRIAYGSLDDCLDAYLSAWVASLPEEDREPLGDPPHDVIWRPRIMR